MIRQVNPNISYLLLTRNDNNKNLDNTIYIDEKKFHAKIYVVDNFVIIGSQNIYKVTSIPLNKKTGELSVVFNTTNANNIIYQTLMLMLEDEYEDFFSDLVCNYGYNDDGWVDIEKIENYIWLELFKRYNLESFLNISSGFCPVCGKELRYYTCDEDLIYCPQYNEKYSRSECGDYNSCKYCIKSEPAGISNINHECAHCSFYLGYSRKEMYKRPYFSYISLTQYHFNKELKQFLKLYFYFIDQLGEKKANEIFVSLNILGNIIDLDLNTRSYDVNPI